VVTAVTAVVMPVVTMVAMAMPVVTVMMTVVMTMTVVVVMMIAVLFVTAVLIAAVDPVSEIDIGFARYANGQPDGFFASVTAKPGVRFEPDLWASIPR